MDLGQTMKMDSSIGFPIYYRVEVSRCKFGDISGGLTLIKESTDNKLSGHSISVSRLLYRVEAERVTGGVLEVGTAYLQSFNN